MESCRDSPVGAFLHHTEESYAASRLSTPWFTASSLVPESRNLIARPCCRLAEGLAKAETRFCLERGLEAVQERSEKCQGASPSFRLSYKYMTLQKDKGIKQRDGGRGTAWLLCCRAHSLVYTCLTCVFVSAHMHGRGLGSTWPQNQIHHKHNVVFILIHLITWFF